jgi:DNA-binding response OmpR family regulator
VTQQLSLLLINDHEHPVQRLALFLSARGHRVTSVPTLAVAERVAVSHEFDCIIGELRDVGAVLALTRAVRAAKATPLLMIIASRSVADRVDVIEAGADDCVWSSTTHHEILSRIAAAVRRAARQPR